MPAESLRKGDVFVVAANEMIPADGEIIEGAATVDESAITGESAPVIREAGGDRSAVTGGTTVLSDQIKVRVTANPGESFMDRMIELIEGAKRQRTPNEIALSILLSALTIIFLVVCITLKPFAIYTSSYAGEAINQAVTVTVLISLLVCLIPTTIGGLLSAIGIAGIDRMVQKNVLAMSGRAVEAAGDVDVLLLDKTGTITLGNRQATEFVPAPGVERTRAGRSRAALQVWPTKRRRAAASSCWPRRNTTSAAARSTRCPHAEFVPFTAQTRMSGVDMDGQQRPQGRRRQRAAVGRPGVPAPRSNEAVERISRSGGTPLVVAETQTRPGRHSPQGHRQRRPARPVQAIPRHGHPHHHDHRRQPADRRGHRRRGGRR